MYPRLGPWFDRCAADVGVASGRYTLKVPDYGYAIGELSFTCKPAIFNVTTTSVPAVSVQGGALVTIFGHRFDELPADLRVTLGGARECPIHSRDPNGTEIVCRAPSVNGTGVLYDGTSGFWAASEAGFEATFELVSSRASNVQRRIYQLCQLLSPLDEWRVRSRM